MSSEDTNSPLNDSDSEPRMPLAGYLNDISSEADPTDTVDDHLSDNSSAVNPTTHDGQMSVIGPTLVIKGELEAGENLLVQAISSPSHHAIKCRNIAPLYVLARILSSVQLRMPYLLPPC